MPYLCLKVLPDDLGPEGLEGEREPAPTDVELGADG